MDKNYLNEFKADGDVSESFKLKLREINLMDVTIEDIKKYIFENIINDGDLDEEQKNKLIKEKIEFEKLKQEAFEEILKIENIELKGELSGFLLGMQTLESCFLNNGIDYKNQSEMLKALLEKFKN